MLKFEGKEIIFVKSNRVKGVSQKNQKEYDFGQLTVSDGLESMQLPCEPVLAEKASNQFKRGDKILITVDAVLNNYDRVDFSVTDLRLAGGKVV